MARVLAIGDKLGVTREDEIRAVKRMREHSGPDQWATYLHGVGGVHHATWGSR
jgi:hypothetical protein